VAASDGTASSGSDDRVIAARLETAANGWVGNVGECTVNADLQHAAIKAEIGILVRGFEIEVMPECQLLGDRLKDSEAW
jgi:hypothetical protein